jgi:hypothetical protein
MFAHKRKTPSCKVQLVEGNKGDNWFGYNAIIQIGEMLKK